MREDTWLGLVEELGENAFENLGSVDSITGEFIPCKSNKDWEQLMEQTWRIHTRNRAEYKLKTGRNPPKDYGYWNPSEKDLLKDKLYSKLDTKADVKILWKESLEEDIRNIQSLEGISDRKKLQMITWTTMRHEKSLRDYESIWESLRAWEVLVRECIL